MEKMTKIYQNDEHLVFNEHLLSDKEINAELAKLFERDVKEFSENGAKAFGHILAKHGVSDPRIWLEKKMRETKEPETPPYSYHRRLGHMANCKSSGIIEFSSLLIANNYFIRAHEMAHKITIGLMDTVIKNKNHTVNRIGFCVSDIKIKLSKIKGKPKEIYRVGTQQGMALNEGVTELIAEKLLGISIMDKLSSYEEELTMVRQIAKIAGEDTIIEAAIFDPNILANKWNELTSDQHSYVKLLHYINQRYYFFLNYATCRSPLKKHYFYSLMEKTYKQVEDEIQKGKSPIRVRCQKDVKQSDVVNTKKCKSARQLLENLRTKSQTYIYKNRERQ